MYNIPYYKEKEHSVVITFMQQHPFATLIGSASNLPAATQVPLLVEEREGKTFLKGHIMRNTDHHKALEQNNNVLCLFTGGHAYVSASWYTHAQMASTWNYMSVQAKGTIRFLDEAGLIDILKRTTEHFENNPASPASYDNLPNDYIQRLTKAIIGFEIEVTSIEHTFKLSQNRDRESYQNIIHQLQQGDGNAKEIAEEMQKRASFLFDQHKA